MAEMGTTVITPALVKVPSAGTAVELKPSVFGTSRAATTLRTVLICALPTNTSEIAVGDKNVKAKKGTQASPERRGIGLTPGQSISVQLGDPTQLFVDAETNNDGCTVMELVA